MEEPGRAEASFIVNRDDPGEAAVRIAYALSEVIAIYPITPASDLLHENTLRFVVRGRAVRFDPKAKRADGSGDVGLAARGFHHGVAATVGAAANVGAIRGLAVGGGNQRLGHGRELGHGLIAIVQARLRLQAEVGRLCAGVAGIGTDHGEALCQRAGEGATPQGALGRADVAIEAAVALVVEATVPVIGQAHLEPDGVVASIAALARMHLALHQTMRTHGCTTCVARGDPAAGRRAGRRPAVGRPS